MDLLPILLAILAGLAPVAALLPETHVANPETPRRFGFLPGTPALLLLWASLAFPLGSSGIGLANFALLLAGIDSPWAAYGLVVAISGTFWLLLIRRKQGRNARLAPSSGPDAAPPFPLNWLLALVAALSVMAVLVAMAGILAKSPHGAWDSWAIWSLRGKFFAAGNGFWRNAVDPGFHLSHPEYPVMFSSFLGWSWRLVGMENVAVPQAVGYAFLLSLIGIVGAGIGLLRRASLAWMSVPVLLTPIVMMTVPASLYADLPMGTLSAAAAMVLLLGIASSLDVRCCALTGIFASFCVWIKEEGLLHLAVLGVVALAFAWLARQREPQWWRPVAAFAVSAAPASLFFAWFRFVFVPGASRFAGGGGSSATGGSLFDRVLDLSRYAEIADQIWRMLATIGGLLTHPLMFLAVVLLLLGIHRQRTKSPAFLAACAMLALLWAGYLVSFVLLSARPGTVLAASLHRLWVHTWPLLVVVVFLMTKTPEDLAIPVPARLSRTERKGAKAARGRSRKGEV